LTFLYFQESAEDWAREAGEMAAVYGHAIFTISVLHAGSSHGGLFIARPVWSNFVFESSVENATKGRMGIIVGSPEFDSDMKNPYWLREDGFIKNVAYQPLPYTTMQIRYTGSAEPGCLRVHQQN
jgi:hypothetical protein